MRVAVVGAGPAGLTAAHRLRAMGHEVTVMEAGPLVGGRTHTEHFGPGHWSDDGAGWLGTFYPDTLALLDELGLRDRLNVVQLRGGGDLLIDGAIRPNPNSVPRILSTGLLTPAEKVRFLAWMGQLFATQRGELRIDERYDAVSARQRPAHGGSQRGGAGRPAGVRGPVLLAPRGAVGRARAVLAAGAVGRDLLPGRGRHGQPVAPPGRPPRRAHWRTRRAGRPSSVRRGGGGRRRRVRTLRRRCRRHPRTARRGDRRGRGSRRPVTCHRLRAPRAPVRRVARCP